jgi:hypothetical protein
LGQKILASGGTEKYRAGSALALISSRRRDDTAMRKNVRNRFLRTLLALGSVPLLASPVLADPITFDFSEGALGELGPSLEFSDGDTVLLRVTGFHFDGTSWLPTPLYRRNEPNDHGLGVCSPSDEIEGGECPGPDGGGDYNELDNFGDPELILLELVAPGWEWVSVGLSSLDTNDGTNPESGRLWFSSSPDPLDRFGPFRDFMGDDLNVEPDIPGSEFPLMTSFLFFEPMSVGEGGAPIAPRLGSTTTIPPEFNNDFLVRSAVIQQTSAVPEPSSLLALGVGLAARGLRGGRWRASAAGLKAPRCSGREGSATVRLP